MLERARAAGGFLVFVVALTCVAEAAHAQASTHPESAAAAELHEAVIAAGRGNTAGALAQAESLVTRHPGYAPGLKFKGAMLEESGHAQEAEDCYEQALKLAPRDTDLLYKVGVYRLSAGDSRQAVDLFTRRVRSWMRKMRKSLFYLAQAYHQLGQNDVALRTIAKSVKLDPQDPPILQKYGELLCSSGDNTGSALMA